MARSQRSDREAPNDSASESTPPSVDVSGSMTPTTKKHSTHLSVRSRLDLLQKQGSGFTTGFAPVRQPRGAMTSESTSDTDVASDARATTADMAPQADSAAVGQTTGRVLADNGALANVTSAGLENAVDVAAQAARVASKNAGWTKLVRPERAPLPCPHDVAAAMAWKAARGESIDDGDNAHGGEYAHGGATASTASGLAAPTSRENASRGNSLTPTGSYTPERKWARHEEHNWWGGQQHNWWGGQRPARASVKLTPKQREKRKYALMEQLGATEITNSKGSFLVRAREFPRDYRHGIASVAHAGNLTAEWRGCFHDNDAIFDRLNPETMVYLDTETSGLSTTAGTYAFNVGLGWLEEDRVCLEQLVLSDPCEEKAMLEYLRERFLTSTCGGVVTYNGKAFDMPLLDTRFTIQRMRHSATISRIPHLDMLYICRRLWKGITLNCRLSHLEEVVLQVPRHDDIPGSEIPEAYNEYLRTSRCQDIVRIITHNASDILALMGLTGYVVDLLSHPEAHYATSLEARLSLLLMSTDHVPEGEARLTRCPETFASNELGKRALLDLARRKRQCGAKDQAFRLWQTIWQKDASCLEAGLNIAKYLEHEVHQIAAALDLTKQLLGLRNLTFDEVDDLQKRLARLQYKCDNDGRRPPVPHSGAKS